MEFNPTTLRPLEKCELCVRTVRKLSDPVGLDPLLCSLDARDNDTASAQYILKL